MKSKLEELRADADAAYADVLMRNGWYRLSEHGKDQIND